MNKDQLKKIIESILLILPQFHDMYGTETKISTLFLTSGYFFQK